MRPVTTEKKAVVDVIDVIYVIYSRHVTSIFGQVKQQQGRKYFKVAKCLLILKKVPIFEYIQLFQSCLIR